MPTAALNTSVHGHAPVAVYDTQPVAGSDVVNEIVAPDDVRFEVAMFVMSGAVVVGASGPPATHNVPLATVAVPVLTESSAADSPAPSLKRQ